MQSPELNYSNITYQAFGLAQSWTWSNGLSYSRSFDQDGRITSYPLGANVRALAFDAASRISGYTDTAPAANQLFDYDNLDRLTRWIAPSTNQSYNYDANGNRTHLTISATPYAYTVNPGSNRLNNVAGPSAKTYSYDAAGHITGDGSRLYLYTPAGFMYGSLPSTWPNPDVTFNRNGMNLRVQKTAAGISTLYRYDNNNHLIGEYTGSGSAIQETIYLGDQPIGILQGTQRYYIFADHLNTPRLISNTANQVRWKWDSDPFGTDTANENPSGLGTFNYNLRFPGQYFDKETGLSNNYYRDYDSGTGRYLQSDFLGLFGGGFSTYGYANQNPLSFIDFLGLSPAAALGVSSSGLGVGAAIGNSSGSSNSKVSGYGIIPGYNDERTPPQFWPSWMQSGSEESSSSSEKKKGVEAWNKTPPSTSGQYSCRYVLYFPDDLCKDGKCPPFVTGRGYGITLLEAMSQARSEAQDKIPPGCGHQHHGQMWCRYGGNPVFMPK